MQRVSRFIIVPFRLVRGRPVQGELRKASTEHMAIETARRMSQHFAGVVALEVIVDLESGEMHDPRELATFGSAPDLLAEAEAA